MKTVILCGGKGTRLAGDVEYKPKPLVEIGNKPILSHIMDIYEKQGFKEFVLCLGYKGSMIKDYFLNLEAMTNDITLDMRTKQTININEHNGLTGKIHLVNTGINSMTGARIARIKKLVGNDEDFFLTYADGLANIDLHKLYEHHKTHGKILTLTAVNPVYRFGLLEIDKGVVTKFDEKPDMKDVINGGFMVANKRIFEYLSEEENCTLEQEAMKKLTKEGQLAAYEHKGFWQCMDTQKEVDYLNSLWEKGAPWIVR